jgi:hypothetical protein
VKFGCLKFHHYLSGSDTFTTITDHKPLISLFASRSWPPPRIERMALRLQDLKFKIAYQPGVNNPADVLSRQPLPMPQANAGEVADTAYIATAIHSATPLSLSLDRIREATTADTTARAAGQTGRWSADTPDMRSLHAVQHELSCHDGVLLKSEQIFMPVSLRYRCLQLAHQGHQGIKKTLARLQQKVWWPGMRAGVENFVASCLICQACTNEAEVKATPLKPTELPAGPWLDLGLDFLGPIRGHMLLVCTDYHSRFPLVHAFQGTTSASAVTQVLRS